MQEASGPSVPLERALAPDVDEPEREDEEEDHHLDEPEDAEPAEEERPRVEEHHLDVEDDEEDGGEVELDREPAPRGAARHVAALERLLLDRRRAPGTEQRGDGEKYARHERRQREHGEHRDVLELHEGIRWWSRQSTQACQLRSPWTRCASCVREFMDSQAERRSGRTFRVVAAANAAVDVVCASARSLSSTRLYLLDATGG